jgi:hypothetical protein
LKVPLIQNNMPVMLQVLTYIAEISQPHVRGMLSATGPLFVMLGILIQFLMGTMLSWRNVAAINVTLPVTAIVALCFVPESPYWLIGMFVI